MKLRHILSLAAIVVGMAIVSHANAQPMAPYGPAGSPYAAAYAGGGPAGMPAAYPAPVPMMYDMRQEAAATAPNAVAANCESCNQGCNCGSDCRADCECWCHRVAVYGEFLYLNPRNAEVAYATQFSNPNLPLPDGRMGVVDQDWDPGVRLGLAFVLDGCHSVTTQFTHFASTRFDEVVPVQGGGVRSLVSFPAAAGTFTEAEATHDLEFRFLDVDYRSILTCDDCQNVAFLVGVRAGQYNQEFTANFASTTPETVLTEIDFYGAGLRLGLEGERYTASRRWLVYGKSYANFVAGEFTADYTMQRNAATLVDNTWKASRIVPMLDLELGAGWQSRCGTWRVTGGYMLSAWYNTVKTNEWLGAMDSGDFSGLSGSTSFDGLVFRVEGRF